MSHSNARKPPSQTHRNAIPTRLSHTAVTCSPDDTLSCPQGAVGDKCTVSAECGVGETPGTSQYTCMLAGGSASWTGTRNTTCTSVCVCVFASMASILYIHLHIAAPATEAPRILLRRKPWRCQILDFVPPAKTWPFRVKSKLSSGSCELTQRDQYPERLWVVGCQIAVCVMYSNF